jgi:outer membrane protein TolC
VFRQQVMTKVTQVPNYYYDLTNYYQYLVIAREGLAAAEQQKKDVEKESERGVIAKFDLLRAQSETTFRRQLETQVTTACHEQEELLKTAISGQNADHELSAVDIVRRTTFRNPRPALRLRTASAFPPPGPPSRLKQSGLHLEVSLSL